MRAAWDDGRGVFFLCLYLCAPTRAGATPPEAYPQLCHQGAGYYSDDCGTAQPHCWHMTANDGVKSAKDCQARCAHSGICSYFAFHKHYGPSCYLLPHDATFYPSLPGVISGTTSCVIPDMLLECHESSGFLSAEPPQPGIVDLDSCKARCDDDPSCLAFSFNRYLRTCAFTTGNLSSWTSTYYPWLVGVVSGRRHCDLPASALKCNVDLAYWQPEAEVTEHVNTADECQKLCRSDPECKFFTFEGFFDTCSKMRTGKVSLWPFWRGAISGKRDCNMSKLCEYRRGSFVGGELLPVGDDFREDVKVVRGCREACQFTPNCSYFNFNVDLDLCELRDEDAHHESSAVVYMSGQRDCELPMGESFCAEDAGAYVPAHVVVAPLLNLSAWECQERCNVSSTCRYFSYELASYECWLMEHAKRNPSLLGYWSGTRDCEMPGKGSCLVDSGYTVDGVAGNFGATSPSGCLDACKHDPDCHYFSFNVVLLTCSLLGPDARLVDYMPGVISGPRNCSENWRPSRVMLQLKEFGFIFFPGLMHSLETFFGFVARAKARDCPLGSANFWGANTCNKCSNGSSRRRGGITRCVPCVPGTYNIGDGDDCKDSDAVILSEASKEHLETVRALHQLNTNVDHALWNASRQHDIPATRTLLKAGANGSVALQNAVKQAIECVCDQGGCQSELDALDSLWQTRDLFGDYEEEQYYLPFEEAVKRGALSVVKFMIKKNMFERQKKGLGHTALHVAAEEGRENESLVLIRDGDMDVEHMNKKRLTPIDVAVMNDHDEEAKLLRSYGRDWKEALADGRTWESVGASFLAAAGFCLAMIGWKAFTERFSSSLARNDDSDSGSDPEGESGKMPGGPQPQKERAALGARLLAARACSPAVTGRLVKLQRVLGVLANLVFPGTFCVRYVHSTAWVVTLAALYILPAMWQLGWRTVCHKPALIFCFPDINLLGLHQDKLSDRLRRWGHLAFSVGRAGLLLPLAIFLGGRRFHDSYTKAAALPDTPRVVAAWYTFAAMLEYCTPSLAMFDRNSLLANPEVDEESDLVSYLHWHPAAGTGSVNFPLKLCPFAKMGVDVHHCYFETTFNLYRAMLCWYAFLGIVTYFWCAFTLLLYICCRQHDYNEGRAHIVEHLALEIERMDDASRLADLEPGNEELPQEVRAGMCSRVRPAGAITIWLATFLMVLDLALDLNTQLTMFVEKNYKSASLLLWFFFSSLLFELWDGGLFHVRDDASEAVRRGFLLDRTLNVHSRENGFEAFGSLLVTTAALLGALKTPWQFMTGILSLLSSVNGLATYIVEEVDLLGCEVEEEDDGESLDGESIEESCTEDGCLQREESGLVQDSQVV